METGEYLDYHQMKEEVKNVDEFSESSGTASWDSDYASMVTRGIGH
jgi:hypothetical protein